ncbi:unnamed protein product [Lactuca saligna]|uniref:Uncharacterized protein n=1 Tax=Lactuca saligna TaxID=75948 RepID=A0AA35Y734_LACSI|nr:unnamed protein product [Lactuca saligna]
MRLTMSVSFAATCFNGSQFRPLIRLLEAMPKELGASLHDMLNVITDLKLLVYYVDRSGMDQGWVGDGSGKNQNLKGIGFDSPDPSGSPISIPTHDILTFQASTISS